MNVNQINVGWSRLDDWKSVANKHQENEMSLLRNDAFITFVFLVASVIFYLAGSDDHELTTPTGSEDNVISFAYLDPSDSQLSGMEPEDEHGTLNISGTTSDGFDPSWRLKAHGVYNSSTVEYKDMDVSEVQLPGDATGSRIEGLTASTGYQVKLYETTSSQRSALLEADAVTGIRFSFGLNINWRHFVLLLLNSFSHPRNVLLSSDMICMLLCR